MATCAVASYNTSTEASIVWFIAERNKSSINDQSIPANTLTDVVFNQRADAFSQLNNPGGTFTTWTCVKNAIYVVTFQAYLILTGANNSIVIELFVQRTNGSTTSYRGQQFNDYAGSSACLTGCTELQMNVGDTAKVRVYSSNASTIENFNDIHLTNFTAHQVPTQIYNVVV